MINLKIDKKFDKFIFVLGVIASILSTIKVMEIDVIRIMEINIREIATFLLVFKYVYPMIIFTYWAYDDDYRLLYGTAFFCACIVFSSIVAPLTAILMVFLFNMRVTTALMILIVFYPFFISYFYQFFKILSYKHEKRKREILEK